MIWLFERGDQMAILEVLYIPPNKYELRFVDGARVEHVETFTNSTDAGNRQVELKHTLAAQGWSKTGEWKL